MGIIDRVMDRVALSVLQQAPDTFMTIERVTESPELGQYRMADLPAAFVIDGNIRPNSQPSEQTYWEIDLQVMTVSVEMSRSVEAARRMGLLRDHVRLALDMRLHESEEQDPTGQITRLDIRLIRKVGTYPLLGYVFEATAIVVADIGEV